MTEAAKLSDYQWCMLQLLLAARERGITAISRRELLENEKLPVSARAGLVFGALTMSGTFVTLTEQNTFEITAEGEAAFKAKYGGAKMPSIDFLNAIVTVPMPERKLQ